MAHQQTVHGVPGGLTARRRPGTACHDHQVWTSVPRPIDGYGPGATLTVSIRHDDDCHNGHDSFAVTGEVRTARRRVEACGCLHDEIAQVFPELAHLIRWHLCSTDGPMPYLANAPREELKAALEARLPALIAAMRADVEAIGFEFEAPVTE